jgi:alpha,alpha-trehalase
VISAWTKGGNVPNATVRLQAVPDSLTPEFTFGCGSNDGTASCDLGAIDAKSAERQLEAEATVPATASTVKSVRLTVIGSAANLSKDPKAATTVTITKPASSEPTTTPTTSPTTSPLPVGSLPAVGVTNPTTGATLSPGGNAAGLFPTLKPSPSPNSSSSGIPLNPKARQAADTSALPESTPVVGAQLAGLAALLVAFVLAMTRFSSRRRPAPAAAAAAGASPAEPTAAAAAAKKADSKPSDAASEAPEPTETAEPAKSPADPSHDGDSAPDASDSDGAAPDA